MSGARNHGPPRSQRTPRNGHSHGSRRARKPVLVLGGAGFVGTNLAARLLCEGTRVIVLDDLSRHGSERNVAWLSAAFGEALEVRVADVRDGDAVRAAVRRASMVYHFAAQVAVTTSLVDPRADFEVNVGGTLQVLEALRELDEPPPLLFASTNKVYGTMPDLDVAPNGMRYEPIDPDVRRNGISETRPLDCYTHGCSKGAADQYVLDFARNYDIPAVVFRMSCIYGPRQNGSEHQGWLAHLLRNALRNEPIRIFGDGMQVRDLLYVTDLVDALLLVRDRARDLIGRAFNIGGGTDNSISLREFVQLAAELFAVETEAEYHPSRPGDQLYFVSDSRAFREAVGWRPRVGVREGIERVADWMLEGVATESAATKAAVAAEVEAEVAAAVAAEVSAEVGEPSA